jgi:hypothetical protein
MLRSVHLSERFSVGHYENEPSHRDLKLTHGELLAFGCRVMPLRYISRRPPRCVERPVPGKAHRVPLRTGLLLGLLAWFLCCSADMQQQHMMQNAIDMGPSVFRRGASAADVSFLGQHVMVWRTRGRPRRVVDCLQPRCMER